MTIKMSAVESFKDDRADRFFDLYPHMQGQITIANIAPKQFSGWHRHKLQYDIFFVASGTLKIGIIAPNGEITEVFLDSSNPETVLIPSGYWHCYKSGKHSASLVYYLSQKHNEDDEYRASEEDIFNLYGYRI